MPERNRFLRGMTVWVGFTQTAVTYRREARAGGTNQVHGAEDAALLPSTRSPCFSHAPLQWATMPASAARGSPSSASRSRSSPLHGPVRARLPSTILIVLLLGRDPVDHRRDHRGYVGRIYDEVKRRPLYVVRDRVNVAARMGGAAHPPAERL
jgi:dolichol-phosphate mannosyltransferase